MKKLFFTPGPSQLFYTVEDHIKAALRAQVPSVAHRGQEFMSIHKETTDNLKALLSLPDDFHITFTSSATEIWERIPENLIENTSFHFANGSFSGKFGQAVEALGKNAIVHTAEPGTCPDITKVDIPADVELIGLAQNETSTGVSFPTKDIYALREKHPEALLAIDAVSSLPVVDIDFSKVDMVYFSVQKCFGLPAGLGVWIFNDRCLEKARKTQSAGKLHNTYNSIFNLADTEAKHQTPCTPNVLGIYLLGKVAGDMLEKGLDVIRRESLMKSTLIYHLFNKHSGLTPFVSNQEHRSMTVGVAKVNGTVPKNIIDTLSQKGMVIGGGYGAFKNEHIRIANFPTHSKEQMELLVDTMMDMEF